MGASRGGLQHAHTHTALESRNPHLAKTRLEAEQRQNRIVIPPKPPIEGEITPEDGWKFVLDVCVLITRTLVRYEC